MSRKREYTEKEEIANTISHGFGILLGIAAAFILIPKAIENNSKWDLISTLIYLGGMLSSYISSTVYHGCRQRNRKLFLQKVDHASIYLHIAGTYTPFTLIVLREEAMWGWGLFAFIWLAALSGTIISFLKKNKHSHIETICFVVMGSAILIAIKPLINTLNPLGQIDALYWLIGGGISYVVGALFYSWTKRAYMHTVFHFFVLGGSICHIIAIYLIL